jgi:molecular chaperone DnaK (HSP70)
MESHLESLNMVEDDNNLIIGLDFGTTYSGVAYLFTGTEKPEATVVTEWPGAKGANKPKVPTLIRYEKSSGGSYTWGYELAHSTAADKIEGIKLLLDPDHPKPLYVPQSNTKAELQRLGKPAVDVAADYIVVLYKHALSKIDAAWPEDYLAGLQKKFVLTVPAVWSDKAKDSTMRVTYPIRASS